MNYMTKEDIEQLKQEIPHPKFYIEECSLSYPTIKYEDDATLAWEEFDKCFNIKYKKPWANKLRTKFAENKTAYSYHGRMESISAEDLLLWVQKMNVNKWGNKTN